MPSNRNNFDVDWFNKFDLLVSIDGVRPSTGYSISISNRNRSTWQQ
jgi:hypothetical protein